MENILGNQQAEAESWFTSVWDQGKELAVASAKDAGRSVLNTTISSGLENLVYGDQEQPEFNTQVSPLYSQPGYEAIQTAYNNQQMQGYSYGATVPNLAEIYGLASAQQNSSAALINLHLEEVNCG